MATNFERNLPRNLEELIARLKRANPQSDEAFVRFLEAEHLMEPIALVGNGRVLYRLTDAWRIMHERANKKH
jgi:hypothetical protein